MTAAETIPVIVGAGECVDRPADPARALEPAALMVAALRCADADHGGAALLGQLDSLDVVNSISWHYADLPGRVTALLAEQPRRLAYGPVGGESPVRFLHEAASRIARGESAVAAVCGGEASHAVAAAQRAGVALPWPAQDPGWSLLRSGDAAHPMAKRLGVAQPTHVYPFYENASQAAWGQTPAEGQADSAALWSALSAVAAGNPAAWLPHALSAATIGTPSTTNRPIAWPYTKLTVANPAVNQGAAILVTSLARARAVGIPERRMLYFHTGASAAEPSDYVRRDQYARSHAMEVVLRHCQDTSAGFDAVELYSCFPCVPKMAARVLGLAGRVPTVTGGLTFFGAPLNNYMTHAAAAMVRTLRTAGGCGLLYGQGGFVTRHHGLVLATQPGGDLPERHSLQPAADARRGAIPEIVEQASGRATVETHTVLYARDGTVGHGVVVLRTTTGARTMARVPAADGVTLARLVDPARSAVGMPGTVGQAADGVLEWAA